MPVGRVKLREHIVHLSPIIVAAGRFEREGCGIPNETSLVECRYPRLLSIFMSISISMSHQRNGGCKKCKVSQIMR